MQSKSVDPTCFDLCRKLNRTLCRWPRLGELHIGLPKANEHLGDSTKFTIKFATKIDSSFDILVAKPLRFLITSEIRSSEFETNSKNRNSNAQNEQGLSMKGNGQQGLCFGFWI